MAPVFWAGLILLLPLPWLLSAFLAAGVHELCHLLAIMLWGGHVREIRLAPLGAEIVTEPISGWKEVISAAAGPLGSLSLLLFAERAPLTALFGLLQGAYNLLPVYPLDGGRILGGIADLFFPGSREAVLRGTAIVIPLLLFGVTLVLAVRFSGLRSLTPALFFLILRLLPRKRPCKPGKMGVQ